MGICLSTEERERRRQNEAIEAQLRLDRLRMRNEVKMLLLGKSSMTHHKRSLLKVSYDLFMCRCG